MVIVENTVVKPPQVEPSLAAVVVPVNAGVITVGSPVSVTVSLLDPDPEVATSMAVGVGVGGGTPVTHEQAEEIARGSRGSAGPAGCTRHIET